MPGRIITFEGKTYVRKTTGSTSCSNCVGRDHANPWRPAGETPEMRERCKQLCQGITRRCNELGIPNCISEGIYVEVTRTGKELKP